MGSTEWSNTARLTLCACVLKVTFICWISSLQEGKGSTVVVMHDCKMATEHKTIGTDRSFALLLHLQHIFATTPGLLILKIFEA